MTDYRFGTSGEQQVDPNTALWEGRLFLIADAFNLAAQNDQHRIYIETGAEPVILHAYTIATKEADRDLRLKSYRGVTVTGGTPLTQARLNGANREPALPFVDVRTGLTSIDSFEEEGADLGLTGEAYGAPAQMRAISVLAASTAYALEITNAFQGKASVVASMIVSWVPT